MSFLCFLDKDTKVHFALFPKLIGATRIFYMYDFH